MTDPVNVHDVTGERIARLEAVAAAALELGHLDPLTRPILWGEGGGKVLPEDLPAYNKARRALHQALESLVTFARETGQAGSLTGQVAP